MSRHWHLDSFVPALNHYGIEADLEILRAILEVLPNTPRTIAGLKVQAEALPRFLQDFTKQDLKRTKALEVVAKLHGFPNWHAARQTLPDRIPPFDPERGWKVVPPAGHQPYEDPHAFITPLHERDGIPGEMYRAFEDYFNRRLPPQGWVKAALEGRTEEAVKLAGERGHHVRPLLALANYYSWGGAFGSPEKVQKYLANPFGDAIPIGGVNVGGVIAALYNVAEPVAYGFANFDVKPWTTADGAGAYQSFQRPGDNASGFVGMDYLGHTRMKLQFNRTGWLDVSRFEEGRFPGMAAYAVDVYRESRQGPCDSRLLSIRHLLLLKEAKQSDIDLHTPVDDPSLSDAGRQLLSLLRRTAPKETN